MFKCVDCGYSGREFNVGVDGASQGALTYFAKCPECGSCKVKQLPGYKEKDLRLYIEAELHLLSKIL